MDYQKTITYLENSFLKPLLLVDTITDISYNGESIYYLDNLKGRIKSEILLSQNEAKDFIRQLSFMSGKQFSYQHPFLDVSIGRYRLHAVHPSIGRIGNQEALTFCIRLASIRTNITRDNGFMPLELVCLFDVLLDSKVSIAIGGVTGSGKTELQKYLLSNVKKNSRIIIIDNVLELEQVRFQNDADINTWQVDERNVNASIQTLVKNALRSNPDWLVVAESRGGEMLELLNSMMTGHPMITTLHALDIEGMPFRIIRMIMMNEQKMNYEDVKSDLLYHLHFFIYLKHTIDETGLSHRFISDIHYIDNSGLITRVYHKEKDDHYYEKIPKNGLKLLKIRENDDLFIKTFCQQEIENE